MNTTLRNLVVLVIALAAVSVWLYSQETRRGTDLVSGSDFIKGLDLSKVDAITIQFGSQETSQRPKIVLKRDAEQFVLAEHKSYPAATDKVNTLMFTIANVQVKKLINADASDDELKAMELSPDSPRSVHVTIAGEDGKAMMAFRLGKDQASGGTTMVKDGTRQVYLSTAPVFLARSYKDFVDWALFSISPDTLDRVEQNTPQLAVERLAGKLVIMDPAAGTPLPAGPEGSQKAQQWFNQLTQLDFEDFWTRDDAQIKSLNLDFGRRLTLTMKDKVVYELELAQTKGSKEGEAKHYAALAAKVADLPSEVVINPNDDQQKLAEVEAMLAAKETAERINRAKGPWVYQISKADYDRLIKTKADFGL